MIKKAIIPVAGLGTRFLPATKAVAKEMLPVVDKPVIQYIVEEAAASGITDIIFVTSQYKRSIEDHFDRSFELEYRLEKKGKLQELRQMKEIANLANFYFVRQDEPLGDGHAILKAQNFISQHEAFAVLYGDDIVINTPLTPLPPSLKLQLAGKMGGRPCLGQLIDVYEKYGDSVIALEQVPKSEVDKYGVIAGTEVEDRVWQINKIVEKPEISKAPSDLTIVGKYVVPYEIFDSLKQTRPSKVGEIYFSHALRDLLKTKPMYGCKFEGIRYDCGSKEGWLKANIEIGGGA